MPKLNSEKRDYYKNYKKNEKSIKMTLGKIPKLSLFSRIHREKTNYPQQ